MANDDEIDFLSEWLALVRSQMKAAHPTWRLSGNALAWRACKEMDACFFEWGMNPFAGAAGGNWRYTPNTLYGPIALDSATGASVKGEGYDKYADSVADHGETPWTIHTFIDSSSMYAYLSNYYYHDRGNRGALYDWLSFKYAQMHPRQTFFQTISGTAVYFQNDSVRYWNAEPDGELTGDLTIQDPGPGDITALGTFDGFTADGTYNIIIVGPGAYQKQPFTLTKSGSTFTLGGAVRIAFSAGATIHKLLDGHLSTMGAPPAERVYYWDGYIPVQDISLDEPDTVNGLMGDAVNGVAARGNRKMNWVDKTTAGGLFADVSRRDWKNGIILLSRAGSNFDWTKYNTYSNVLTVNDGNGNPVNFWVLRADG
jgi:hypothetical protein